MGFWSNLIGGGAAEPVEAVGNVLDKLFTSDEERAVADQVMEKIRQQPHLVQAEINKVEASHRSIFVAGWRPFIGWICGFGLGYVWILRPMIMDIATAINKTVVFVPMDTSNMIDLVIALLGLGGLRTFEKMKGKSK